VKLVFSWWPFVDNWSVINTTIMTSQIEYRCSHPGTHLVNDLAKVMYKQPAHCVLFIFKCGEKARRMRNGCEAGDTCPPEPNKWTYLLQILPLLCIVIHIQRVISLIYVWTTVLCDHDFLYPCMAVIADSSRKVAASRKFNPHCHTL